MMDIKTTLEAMNVNLGMPQYSVALDAQTMLAVGRAIIRGGAKPSVTVPSYTDLTIMMTERNRSGIYKFKCFCRDKRQAAAVREDLERELYLERLRYEADKARQTILPGFEEEEEK
jgi:hypothetical protein